MDIIPFATLTPAQLQSAANILLDSLAHVAGAWKTMDEANEEIGTRLVDPDWTGFAAVEDGELLGWIGGIASYSHAWEVHPLVVAPGKQRRGVGKALIGALEDAARHAGALSLYLGSDDDFGGTTAFGADLLADVPASIRALSLTPGSLHPLEFYRSVGFVVVGFIPDADGPGKPDIWFAKRL